MTSNCVWINPRHASLVDHFHGVGVRVGGDEANESSFDFKVANRQVVWLKEADVASDDKCVRIITRMHKLKQPLVLLEVSPTGSTSASAPAPAPASAFASPPLSSTSITPAVRLQIELSSKAPVLPVKPAASDGGISVAAILTALLHQGSGKAPKTPASASASASATRTKTPKGMASAEATVSSSDVRPTKRARTPLARTPGHARGLTLSAPDSADSARLGQVSDRQIIEACRAVAPGIGTAKAEALMTSFGSLRSLACGEEEQLRLAAGGKGVEVKAFFDRKITSASGQQ